MIIGTHKMRTIFDLQFITYLPNIILGEEAKNRGFFTYKAGSFSSVIEVDVKPIFK